MPAEAVWNTQLCVGAELTERGPSEESGDAERRYWRAPFARQRYPQKAWKPTMSHRVL